MASKRFPSKIDSWILIILVFLIVVQLIVIVAVAIEEDDPRVVTGVIIACILAMGLFAWLLTGTHYTVYRGQLKIASGPFRRTVAIDQITSVEATRNPLSSPALSLDRLCIRYGRGRRVMISPADQRGFLRAIGHDLTTRTSAETPHE